MAHARSSRWPLLALALAAVFLVSGCVGGQAGGAGATLKARPPALHDDAAILGVITDVEGRPLPEARVRVPELDLAATVYGDGSYLAYPVPPGTYTIQIQLDGFVPLAQRAGVERGGTAYVDAVLTRVGAPEAWMETLELSGFIECSAQAGVDARADAAALLNKVDDAMWNATGLEVDASQHAALATAGAGYAACRTLDPVAPNTTNDRTLHVFATDPGLRTLVFETAWEPVSAMAERLTVLMEVRGFANMYPGTFFREEATSPHRMRYGPAAWAWMDDQFRHACSEGRTEYCGYELLTDGFPIQARVFAEWQCMEPRAGACLVMGQPYAHYASAFYLAEAPPGWTVLGA